MTNKFSPGKCCGCNDGSCTDCHAGDSLIMRPTDYDVVYYNPVYSTFPTPPALIDKVSLDICRPFNTDVIYMTYQGSTNNGLVQFPYLNNRYIPGFQDVSGYLLYHDDKACYWKSPLRTYENNLNPYRPYYGLSIADERFVDTEIPWYTGPKSFDNTAINSIHYYFYIYAYFCITKNPRIYKYTLSDIGQIVLGDLIFNGTGLYRFGGFNLLAYIFMNDAYRYVTGATLNAYYSYILDNMLFTPQRMEENTCCQPYNLPSLTRDNASYAFIISAQQPLPAENFVLSLDSATSLSSDATINSRMEMASNCE